MSQHPPEHIPDPARPADPDTSGVDTALNGPAPIDLVAGDPPVPITVWRTARTGTDDRRGIGARLAYRLVAAYSRPGETVVDLTTGHTLSTACRTGRRRHHPGWFTDAASLIIGPRTPPAEPTTRAAGASADGDPPDLAAWFGDDLTDLDPPPAGDPTALPDNASVQQATSLVVASWPLDAVDAVNRVKLAWLLAACARLLRPGGCLILVVTPPAGARPEDFSPVADAAAGTGLGYLQHIVAVTADTDGDQFVYHATDEELLTLAHQPDRDRPRLAHLRVHADLLIFAQPQTPDQPRRARRGANGHGAAGRRG